MRRGGGGGGTGVIGGGGEGDIPSPPPPPALPAPSLATTTTTPTTTTGVAARASNMMAPGPRYDSIGGGGGGGGGKGRGGGGGGSGVHETALAQMHPAPASAPHASLPRSSSHVLMQGNRENDSIGSNSNSSSSSSSSSIGKSGGSMRNINSATTAAAAPAPVGTHKATPTNTTTSSSSTGTTSGTTTITTTTTGGGEKGAGGGAGRSTIAPPASPSVLATAAGATAQQQQLLLLQQQQQLLQQQQELQQPPPPPLASQKRPPPPPPPSSSSSSSLAVAAPPPPSPPPPLPPTGHEKRPPPPSSSILSPPPTNFSDHLDSNEQVSLLNRLANAEGISQVKQDRVMAVMPDWHTLEKAGLIPPGLSRVLSKLDTMDLDDFAEMLSADPDLVVSLFGLLRLESDVHTVQYVLTLFCEAVRDDSSKYEALCTALQHADVFHTFQRLLESPTLGSYTADRAALLLSGLMCRARSGTFSDDEVEYLIQGLMMLHTRSSSGRGGRGSNTSGKFLLSEAGRLDAAANLLKIDRYRPLVWHCRGFPDLLLKNLALSQPAGLIYKAVFCTWLLTFHDAFLVELEDKGHVLAICKILKESRFEKVIRVALYVLNNLLKCDAAVETIVEQNVAQVLALLEFEKWRDADLYDEIRAEISHLDVKIRQFNNFDRYCNELQRGALTWSVLHSEKFWRENVMAFEKDEFRAIKQLADLLNSDNKTTLAVACYDLGEFARLHPAGKKTCQKFKVKDRVMLLISDRDREVAGEALLCIQKLMLDRWEDVAELQKK